MRKMWWILSFILITIGIGSCTVLHTLPKFIELIAVSAAMIFVAIYINKKGSNLFLKIAASVLACYLFFSTVMNVYSLFSLPKYLLITVWTVMELLADAIPGILTLLGNLILFVLCITNKSSANNKSE